MQIRERVDDDYPEAIFWETTDLLPCLAKTINFWSDCRKYFWKILWSKALWMSIFMLCEEK